MPRVEPMYVNTGKCLSLVALMLAVSGCSRSPQKYLASGDTYFKAGKYSEAVLQYRNAVERDPKLAKAHFQLAEAYLAMGNSQAAFKELQSTIDLDPGNVQAQTQYASMLLMTRNYDDAKSRVDKILVTDPNNSTVHAVAGQRLALLHDWSGAIREYQTAITLDPKRVENYSSLAAVHLSRNEPSDAETALKQGADANPQSMTARVNLANFYLAQRKLEQAKSELNAASKLAPSDPVPRLLLANVYVAQGNLPEAEKLCLQIKSLAPDDPRAYRALAVFYAKTRQPEKAVTELESLESSRPKDRWIKVALAETLLSLGRVKDAAIPTQELLSADANDPSGLVLNGRILTSEHKYPEARAILEKAIQGGPNSADAYFYLGVAQSAMGMSTEAKVSLEQARKLSPGAAAPEAALAELDASHGHYYEAENLANAHPNDPRAELLGAEAELAKGNLQKAEQMAQASLDRQPANLSALNVLTDVYLREGKAPQALSRLSSLVSEHPRNARLQLLLAKTYYQQKDIAKAEASVRQAISLDPEMPDAHSLLGNIDSANGLKDEAAKEFKAEIVTMPSNTPSYLLLASLYSEQGNWKEEISTLEKAHTMDPSSPYVANNLAFLYMEHGRDPHAALSLAQTAKNGLPNSPVTADTLGWAFYKVGYYEPAIAQLNAATQKAPDRATYQYHLGEAYLAAGRLEPAEQSLQRALKLDANFADAGNARAGLAIIAKRLHK